MTTETRKHGDGKVVNRRRAGGGIATRGSTIAFQTVDALAVFSNFAHFASLALRSISPTPAAHPRSRVPSSVIPTPTIETFTLGPWATNCYLLYDPASKDRSCWVADVSFGPEEMIERIRELGLRPEAVVLTHAHLDHIAGVTAFLSAFRGTPVWIHEAEEQWLNDPILNLSAAIGMPVTCAGPDRVLSHGEALDLGGEIWEVRHTPGHSPGGIALVHAKSSRAITGDSLFAGSVGRTDFPGSDPKTLERSIRQQLYTLADGVTIYPGHGPSSTIGREKKSNPFVRGQ